MADIDVVPKRRTGVWLWVILAIVVVAILWMALGRGSAPRTSRNLDPASFTSLPMPDSPVQLVA